MSYFEKIKRVLLYAGVTKEEFLSIQEDLYKNNKIRFRLFSLVAIIALSGMVAATFFGSNLPISYQTYLIPLLLFLFLVMVNEWFAPNNSFVQKASIHIFVSTLGVFGILLGTVEDPNQIAASFLAFLLVMPLLFILTPLENVAFIVFFGIVFTVISGSVKTAVLYEIDKINAIAFSGVGILISTFMSNVTVENLVMKNAMFRLAETDQLTQLPNRTSFERNLKLYPTICQRSLSCIYVDVNGLHELNNKEGHAAGDRMLQCVGDTLKEQFGQLHAYRIGGDEFVAFAADCEASVVQEKIAVFSRKIRENDYHAAVGFEIQDAHEIHIEQLLKSAEEKMYAAKESYYALADGNRNRR